LNFYYTYEGEEESEIRKKVFDIKLANKRLTEDEIVAQAFVFLLAGYLSTTGALANCMYELAVNPDVQQRLYDEINGAVDSDTGDIEYDRLARLPYLDAVMAETLRHHSLALPLSRYPTRDYKLGKTGSTFLTNRKMDYLFATLTMRLPLINEEEILAIGTARDEGQKRRKESIAVFSQCG